MWRISFFLLVACLLSPAIPADEGTPTKVYDGRFSFTLPSDWQAISPEDLDEISMWVIDTTYGRSVEVYQHGFVSSTFESDPWLPHLLVQIRESGRLNYGSFLHLEPIDELRSTSKNTFPKGLPPLIMGVAVEDVHFDSERLCVRLEHALDLRFKGRVRVLTAAFLTERGVVTLHLADRERRITESRELFDAIVDSAVVAPDIAYQRRVRDRWPGLPFFIAAALVAAALAAYLFRRRGQS